MKLILNGLLVFFYLFSIDSGFAGELVFRKADLRDLPKILESYRHYDQQDEKNLVVYPAEVASSLTEKAIVDGMFLALEREEDESEELISIAKFFLVNSKNVQDKLEEVGVLGDSRRLLSHHFYFLPDCVLNSGNCQEPSLKKEFLSSKKEGIPTDFVKNEKLQNFLYYGGAFTFHKYRGKGIHSKLIHYAARSVYSEIRERGSPNGEIVLLFGQVQDQIENRSVLYDTVLGLFAAGVPVQPQVETFEYLAVKPTFVFDKDRGLQVLFDEQGRGQGSVVVYRHGGILGLGAHGGDVRTYVVSESEKSGEL